MKKTMLYILGIIGLLVVVLIITLFFMSPGKPKQFLDANGNKLKNSISEKLFLDINGSKQGMFIKSKNLDNPVILYLHGGMPVYFLTEKYPTHLEDNFTIVWWDQRNCGISYSSGSSQNKATIEQLVDDTIVLTKYLLERFNKKKIYLMGHSGGTFLGAYVIDKVPELYEAYIGMAQMSDQFLSEKLACNYILNKYTEMNNKKMVERFEKFSFDDQNKIPIEYLKMRDDAMHELGIGTMRKMKNVATDLFLPSLYFSEYSLSDKYHLWAGKSKFGISQNWEKMARTNLIETKNYFKIPVYFFHGLYDYTCSYELTKKYFDEIKAPIKGFYTFDQSAHSPLFEEPEKINKILINDIKNLRTDLADKN
ncbi:MAG: alpha/beta hydrolase [Ignavibacteriales bacterium]|nr:MAG: alpha/beta hydrolase [Ignavibacteriales bacterium]